MQEFCLSRLQSGDHSFFICSDGLHQRKMKPEWHCRIHDIGAFLGVSSLRTLCIESLLCLYAFALTVRSGSNLRGLLPPDYWNIFCWNLGP
jgi:hypothetical protein